jgi:hypothetical protein
MMSDEKALAISQKPNAKREQFNCYQTALKKR